MKPVVVSFGPDGASISPRRRHSYQVAHGRLLNRAHLHVSRLPAEPRRQEVFQHGFEIFDHWLVWRGCVHFSQLCNCSLDLFGGRVGILEAQHQLVLQQCEPGRAVNRTASSNLGVELKSRGHGAESFSRSTQLRPQSRVRDRRSVIAVLDDDVAMAMHGAIIGAPDDDGVGAVLPVPIALPVVIKGFGAVFAMMEASTVFVDDGHAFAIHLPVMMLVGRDDDRISRSHSRRGQAKRQRAQNEGGFHCQFSEKLRCPSPSKHRCAGFVPMSAKADNGRRPVREAA